MIRCRNKINQINKYHLPRSTSKSRLWAKLG